MKNTFGSAVSLTIFGESHGPAVGAACPKRQALAERGLTG